MRRGDALVGKRAGDLAKTSTVRSVLPDPGDDRVRKYRRTSGGTWRWMGPSRLDVLSQEPFELVNGDEPLTPRQLDRVDGWYEPPVDRRDADTECFSGLLAGVGETLDLTGSEKLVTASYRRLDPPVLTASLSLSPSLPTRAHRGRTLISASDSIFDASASRLLSVVLFVHAVERVAHDSLSSRRSSSRSGLA